MLSRFFRFHVSGDIPNREYLTHMIEIASRNAQCQILCFTKRFNYVNEFVRTGGTLPSNLHMIFSGWPGLQMENPYHFPEAHVRFKDGTTTAAVFAKPCQGNCAECARTDEGCWTLHTGEQIVFMEH